MAATDAIASFFCMEVVNGEKTSLEEPVANLASLLDSFKDVFQKPAWLPPSRVQDHAIHLNPGAQPVNFKPYRYPYFQKQVMEQLVADMLREGVIRTNTGPFFLLCFWCARRYESDLKMSRRRHFALMMGITNSS
uniref:Uncharacterized protein n=1 Tax=Nicotiana tabacum TaxID=4097 RepID=A0A1S4DQL1_TOBAC|nr:PREDICTED: uncharacterized protein LOC107832125 [Nicotiana tabacum]